MQWYIDVIIWWLLIELIGFIALPVAGYICSALPDKGYAVSKIMGLLLLTYFSWIITYFGLDYSTFSVFFSLLLIAAISLIFYKKFGLDINRHFAIKNELFFTAIFCVFLVIRSFSPDNYWEIGEKFMDNAFINSILRSSSFPPTDPWFSGISMNYYYFGYLLVADLIKLTGSLLPVGFNIASAIFFALSSSAVFGIGFGLTRKIKYGLVAFVFVLFLGNLVGFMQLLVILFFPAYYGQFYVPNGDLLTRLLTFSQWPSVNIIPGGIFEIPYHVYLVGDLHPDMVSISFQLLILSIILCVLTARTITLFQTIIFGLIAGFFYPLNTWDYPTYIAIIIAAVFLIIKNFKKAILFSGLILILNYIPYLPYHLNFQKVHEIKVVASGRTELVNYLLIFGTFIFMIFYFLLNNNQSVRKNWLKWLVILTVLTSIAFIFGFQLLVLLVPLVILSYSKMVEEKIPEKQFIYLLVLMGTLLSLFVEMFYLKDNMDKLGYFRFNTIFKLYLQIWIMWGIAASYIFYELINKKIIYVTCILLIMASIYPIFVTISQSSGFNVAPSLDGERTIEKEHPHDYQAIEWLRSKNGTPVVLQAAGFSYTWNSYVSAFTGMPTVLGWEWHEYQWRTNLEEINIRRSDVERAYTSSNYEEIKNIISKYDIKYIYVGPVERDRYKITNVFEEQKEKFKLVFKNHEVKIYEVQ
ncbi:MAG: DUF2298 domain-containing protein [Candidatus Methanoperedens sp.]